MIDFDLAEEILDDLPGAVQTYMNNRGSNYGISGASLLRKTPSELLDDPWAIEEFWRGRDISHYEATSKGGCRSCEDNWMAEDPSVNRSRGAEYMHPHERQAAYQDNAVFAKQLGSRVASGAALALGGMAAPAIVEGTGEVLALAAAPLVVTALPWIALAAGVGAAAYYVKRHKPALA